MPGANGYAGIRASRAAGAREPEGLTRAENDGLSNTAESTGTSGGTQKVKLKLSAQAEKYARRDAPIEARQMAARGALPLQPIELATVLFVLANDPEASVKPTPRSHTRMRM